MTSRRKLLRTPSRRGFTLIELMTVVAILAILAGAMVPLISRLGAKGRTTAANASLVVVRDAIMGTPDKPGYLSDTGQLPMTLRDLFLNPFSPTNPLSQFNRESGLGWRGPYLLNANGTYIVNTGKKFILTNGSTVAGTNNGYGLGGDPAILDPWGNPIILQRATVSTPTQNDTFARLISAGPNGVIDTPPSYLNNPYPPVSQRGDDIVLFLQHSDSDP